MRVGARVGRVRAPVCRDLSLSHSELLLPCRLLVFHSQWAGYGTVLGVVPTDFSERTD